MLAYILYELSLLSLALAAQRLVTDKDRGIGEQVCATFAIKLLLTSLIPMAATALRINSPAYYLSVTVVAAIVSLAQFWRAAPFQMQAWSKTSVKEIIAAIVVGLACVPVALGRVGPFSETDSLVNFSYVVEWAHNRHTPYFMAYDYSSLWEMNFIPAVVLHASDSVIWWPPAQAILLFGTTLYLLGRAVLTDRYMTWAVVAATMTLPAFLVVSGYGTLKNDMIYSAGAALLVLALISKNERSRVYSTFLAVAGLVFLSVKYSGPVYSAALIVAWVLIELYYNRSNAKSNIDFIVIAGFSALILGGNYYIKNIVLFHNPLYPYAAKLGPLHLPGEANLPSTSLLSRARELTLWSDFLKSPVYGLAAPVCALLGIFAALFSAAPRRKLGEADCVTAWAALIGMLVYFASTFSDWLGPTLVSMRYVTATIGLLFLVLAKAAARMGRPGRDVVAGLLVWCAANQAISIFDLSFRYDPLAVRLLFFAGAAAIILVSLATTLTKAQYRGVPILVATAVCLMIGTRFTELNRTRYWLPEWSPITKHVSAETHPERIFMLEGLPDLSPLPFRVPAEYANMAPALYPAIGPKFENKVDFGDAHDLARRLKSGLRYDDIAVVGWAKLDPALVDTMSAQIAPFGYRILDKDDFAVLYAMAAH